MANINETISEVQKLNPELARQIAKFVKDHSYGLVFERNLPEAVRLYTKKPAVGDTVNIRPSRGSKENNDNKISWIVKTIDNGVATIERDGEVSNVPVEDLVTIVDYKDTIYPGLKEIDRIERGNPNDPYHMVINAENYHALEALTYAYAGKVDCIYIDPPYNKKDSKDWKYNCDYVDETDKYKHSKWLAFMERRLKLASKLLNPNDSVLIVTIDDIECNRLGLLLEQMFPSDKITMISSVINPGGKGKKGGTDFSKIDEYIFYVQIGNASILPEIRENKKTSIKWRRLIRETLANGRGKHGKGACGPNQFYPIYVDDSTKTIRKIGEPIPEGVSRFSVPQIEGCTTVFPIRPDGTEMNWGCIPSEAKSKLKNGYLRVSGYYPDKPQPYVIQYLTSGSIKDIKSGKVTVEGYAADGSIVGYYSDGKPKMPTTQWNKPSHNGRTYGTDLLNLITGGVQRFDYPKSLFAVRDCLKTYIEDKPNALVIDFFGGSGTTLHAINLLNAEDGGHRRCICITNNEIKASEEEEFTQKGLRQGDEDWEKYGIARYVTWPRTKCSIEGVDVNGNVLEGTYGGEKEVDEVIDDDVFDAETGERISGTFYKKIKEPIYPELAHLKMSDGFKANAIFCELTYESAWNIRLDQAFDAIAPILWMLAGCQGDIIRKLGKSYLTTDYYGVLFDYGQASKFCEKIKNTPTIKTAFVVTDDQRRYSNICRRLPGIEVHRLYESFLKTFEICGEGGLD